MFSRFNCVIFVFLLDIANIESGELELNMSEQELGQLIREIIQMNDVFARAKAMEVVFKGPGIPAMSLIDKPKIEQVVTNLLSNAIKYSFPKTRITVSLELKGQTARVSVRDQGQGIKPEELQKLFKPFRKTSTRSTSGRLS